MKDSKNVSMTKAEKATPEMVESGRYIAPLVDIYENHDEILVIADFPGVVQDNVHINLNKDQLQLEGRVTFGDLGTPLVAEYTPVHFRRAFLVPKGIDGTKINAELKAGVLTVHLPKSESLKPRQIPVRSV